MAEPTDRLSFFEELKRRKVFRVAAIYGATVFAVLQVADILVEPLALPGWTMRLLVLLAVLGLPVALALAWAFEVTPDGVARTPDPGDSVPDPVSTFSRRTYLAVGALVLLGFGAGWFIGPRAADPTPPPAAPPADALASIRANGIAVLPFVGRSSGDGQADFFAAGLHDDLLTQLAGLQELVVISRTSVEQYRDTEKSVPQIGRELAVAYVLEGGVQQADDRIRVNAQLIDARTDEHLWAETLDGDLSVSDIFAIQTELAQRIVAAMETTIAGNLDARLADAPTESLAAWEAVARGRALRASNDLAGAERAFEEAVASDPGFAEAWAHLSESLSTRHWFGLDREDAAREALDRALVLDPVAATTEWARATYEYYVLSAYSTALESIDRAVRAAPGQADFHYTRGLVLRRVGDFPAAAAALTRAAELDPRNPSILMGLIETQSIVRDEAAVRRWTDAFLALPDPSAAIVHYVVGAPLMQSAGRVGYARRVLARLDPEMRAEPPVRLVSLWTDVLDPDTEPPSPASLREALTDIGWTEASTFFLLVQASSLYILPNTDREHLSFLLDGFDRRLAVTGGVQAEALDRSVRAHVLAALGRTDEAVADAEHSLAWVRRTRDRNAGGQILYSLALAFEEMGDRDRAVALLEESAPLWTFPSILESDPMAAELVQDPRVQALLESTGPRRGPAGA